MTGGCDQAQQKHLDPDSGKQRGDDRTRADCGWHFMPTIDSPEDIIFTAEGGNACGSDGKGKRLKIVLLVIGTLGDVLPFIQIGRRLQSDGHSVRLATHLKLRSVVEQAHLAYLPLGGDPDALCDYLCRNKGTLPSRADAGQLVHDYESMRAMVEEMAMSTWHACTAPWPPFPSSSSSSAPPVARPVDAIIANLLVPSALHCASRLDCHLHFMFPQPWAASSYLPHPLWGRGLPARPTPSLSTRATHFLLDELHHLAWRHAIDRLRHTIGLPRLRSADFGAHLHVSHQVPLSVLCSPRLLPRPPDWGPHICITGAITMQDGVAGVKSTGTIGEEGHVLSLTDPHAMRVEGGCGAMAKPTSIALHQKTQETASPLPAASTPSSSPPASPPPSPPLPSTLDVAVAPGLAPASGGGPLPPWLHAWLGAEGAGPPVVLVCFGSMVVPDWPRVTAVLRDAAAIASVRVLLHRPSGSQKLGRGDGAESSSGHLLVLEGRLPHGVLLPYCRAMLHHGGAGTTYTTLQAGKPSMAMPYFGDQFLWGDVLRREGVAPCPSRSLPSMDQDFPQSSSAECMPRQHLQVASMEVDTMAWVLRELVKEQYAQRAMQVAQELRQDEDGGVDQAVRHFYQHYRESSDSRQSRQSKSPRAGWRYGPVQARTVGEALTQAGRGLAEDILRAGVKVLMVPVGGWIEVGVVGMLRGVGAGMTQGVLLVVEAVGDAVHRILTVMTQV